jgi:uncharacterized Zn finger protein
MCPFCGERMQPRFQDRTNELMCANCGIVWVAVVAPPDPAEDAVSLEPAVQDSMSRGECCSIDAGPEERRCPCEDAWPHPSTSVPPPTRD